MAQKRRWAVWHNSKNECQRTKVAVRARWRCRHKGSLPPPLTGIVFHTATGIDQTAVTQVQTTLQKRILRAFVGRGLLKSCAAKDMLSWCLKTSTPAVALFVVVGAKALSINSALSRRTRRLYTSTGTFPQRAPDIKSSLLKPLGNLR
ncbi:MAG: hypothetical protein RL710_657 [Pseudomonadota bacterium]|jgi:hypothetical protein